MESQIQRIANTAEDLIKAMSPTVEAKSLKNNKKVSKEVEVSEQPFVVFEMNFHFRNGIFFFADGFSHGRRKSPKVGGN